MGWCHRGALDRTNNLEIRHESQATVESLRKLLSSYDGIVNYHLNTVEQQLPVAEILEKLVNRDPPDLLVLGSNNREGLQKYVCLQSKNGRKKRTDICYFY